MVSALQIVLTISILKNLWSVMQECFRKCTQLRSESKQIRRSEATFHLIINRAKEASLRLFSDFDI